jgi:beta-lactamase class A
MKTLVRSLVLIFSFSLLAIGAHQENLLISTETNSKQPPLKSYLQNAADCESPASERLRAEIARFEKKTGGSVGVSAVHLESCQSFYYNKDIRFPMASTYKIPVAVKLLSLVEKGEIQLSDMIEIKKSDLHPGSGTIARLLDDPGVILSVQNLLELMLLISDNSATDVCLKYVGGSKSVTQKMREIGITDMDINRPTYVLIAHYLGITSAKEGEPFSEQQFLSELKKMSQEEREQAEDSFSKDLQDTSTPLAMANLLEKIWKKEILNKENSEYLLDIMKRCQTGQARIKGILHPDTVVYHKTGTIGGTTNDVGIIELPADAGNVIAVIFIKDAQVDNEESEEVIAQIARTLYDYFLFTTE